MPEEYLKEELWKLYEKLPEELKEAIFSEKTADLINSICQRNGITEEKISEIARYTGLVLLGVLPPEELPEALEKKAKLRPLVAKKVTREITRFIFYPVKESLALLYKIEISPEKEKPAISPAPSEEPPRLPQDIYREPTE